MLLFNLWLIAALVVVGVSGHSLAVLAEGGDYLADAAGVAVSLIAIWLSQRAATPMRPRGYPRATRIAALVNCGWLLVLNVLVAAAAAWRLHGSTPRVSGLPVVIVSTAAAALMLAGALILRADAKDGDLNLRAVLLDTVADAAAAAGVAVSGGVILATGGWYWLDPALALLIALVIGYRTVALVGEVVADLRATAPT